MKNLYKSFLILSFVLSKSVVFSQIPIYNSYPSAAGVIYLDFDGQYVSGTSWNINGPISCGPANLTPDKITEIFNRVAEDYRPFNINITTDSTKYLAAPPDQRIRIILTITSDWYGSSGGGVSYIGSFNWGDNTPSFVFTELLQYNAKYIAEATSHEAGHTLGLRHQSAYDINCSKTSEYNPGAGTGEIAWAPIMGLGYYNNLTLWHNGSNPYGCNEMQDDLSIISGNIAEGFKADDYGNDAAHADTIPLLNNEININGIIETEPDRDVTQFSLPSFGNFHLDAIPFNNGVDDAGSNLDLQIDLLNNNQEVIGTYNPPLLLSASIDTVLNAGTYFLRVQGKGNIYAPEYASLGSYHLTGSFIGETILPIHQLQLTGINENGKQRLNWSIEADEKVKQQVLELSTDGRTFQPIAYPVSPIQSYINNDPGTGIRYYRLKVVFENGHTYYSNIAALRSMADKDKPYLTGNIIINTISVTSPSLFKYTIFDYNGKLIINGQLVQGTNIISTEKCSSGMYIIRYENGQEQYSEKFMKQ